MEKSSESIGVKIVWEIICLKIIKHPHYEILNLYLRYKFFVTSETSRTNNSVKNLLRTLIFKDFDKDLLQLVVSYFRTFL